MSYTHFLIVRTAASVFRVLGMFVATFAIFAPSPLILKAVAVAVFLNELTLMYKIVHTKYEDML